MAAPLRIYVNTTTRSLVVAPTNLQATGFPELRQGEEPTVQLYFLDSSNANLSNPPSYVNFSGATLKLGIMAGSPTGGPDALIAFQDTWAAISGGFQALLNCSTVAISNAIGNASSVACTSEIEVTEQGGFPVKYFQGGCTIQAAVIDSLSTVPVPISNYLTQNEIDATYERKIGKSGDVLRLVSPSGQWAAELKCNNDGTFSADIIQLF
jgi:hypothetical protein